MVGRSVRPRFLISVSSISLSLQDHHENALGAKEKSGEEILRARAICELIGEELEAREILALQELDLHHRGDNGRFDLWDLGGVRHILNERDQHQDQQDQHGEKKGRRRSTWREEGETETDAHHRVDLGVVAEASN